MRNSLNLRMPILCAECHAHYSVTQTHDGFCMVSHSFAVEFCNSSNSFRFKITDHIKGGDKGTALLNIEQPICLNCGGIYGWVLTQCRLRVKFTHSCKLNFGVIEIHKPLALFTVWV